MEYLIKYTESYSDVYRVEAASFNEAVKKLDEEIRSGYRKGPELCDDSWYMKVEEVSNE